MIISEVPIPESGQSPLSATDPFPPSRFLRCGRSPKSALNETAIYEAVVGNLTVCGPTAADNWFGRSTI